MLFAFFSHTFLVSRLPQQIAILKKLSSPYCVRLYDSFQDDKNVYLVLEYVRCAPLLRVIQDRVGWSERKVALITEQLVPMRVCLCLCIGVRVCVCVCVTVPHRGPWGVGWITLWPAPDALRPPRDESLSVGAVW